MLCKLLQKLHGAKCYLGKVKPLDNAGQRSLDPGAGVSHMSLAGVPLHFIEPVACLQFSTVVQLFASL